MRSGDEIRTGKVLQSAFAGGEGQAVGVGSGVGVFRQDHAAVGVEWMEMLVVESVWGEDWQGVPGAGGSGNLATVESGDGGLLLDGWGREIVYAGQDRDGVELRGERGGVCMHGDA